MTSTDAPRSTPQREAVLSALGSVGDFRSAQEVHELLTGSGIGLATVYRTLQLYADHGLLDSLRREDGEAISSSLVMRPASGAGAPPKRLNAASTKAFMTRPAFMSQTPGP